MGTKNETRERVHSLLRVNPELTNHQLSVILGYHQDTVGRYAAEVRSGLAAAQAQVAGHYGPGRVIVHTNVVYDYADLDENAKEKARDAYRQSVWSGGDSNRDSVYEEIKQGTPASYGITGMRYNLFDTSPTQGRGVRMSGTIKVAELRTPDADSYVGSWNLDEAPPAVPALPDGEDPRDVTVFVRNHPYFGESIELVWRDGLEDRDQRWDDAAGRYVETSADERAAWTRKAASRMLYETRMVEFVEDLEGWMMGRAEAEDDYRDSDEYIDERLADLDFTADGKRA